MEKIIIQPKMSKINLNCMYFEIKLSMKGDIYRARSSTLSKISNIKNIRPEGSSKYSFESAIQNLIPKIEQSLEDTNFKLGKIFTNENGKILFLKINNSIIKALIH